MTEGGLAVIAGKKESGVLLDEPDEHDASYEPPYFYEEQDIFIARDKETVEALKKARRHDVSGRLYGFPETAIAAFLEKSKRAKINLWKIMIYRLKSSATIAWRFFHLSYLATIGARS